MTHTSWNQDMTAAPRDGRLIGVLLSDGTTDYAHYMKWEDTASEYHATTGEYLGQFAYDGGECWMTHDDADKESPDMEGFDSSRIHVTAWCELALPPVKPDLTVIDEIVKCLELFSFRRGLSGMIAHHQVPELAQAVHEMIEGAMDGLRSLVRRAERERDDRAAEHAKATERLMADREAFLARAEKAERDLYLCRLAKEGEMERAEEYRADVEELRLAMLGGEDVPGLAMSLAHNEVIRSHAENYRNVRDRADRAEAQTQDLLDAVEFYADELNWHGDVVQDYRLEQGCRCLSCREYFPDRGDRARGVLAAFRGDEKS